MLRIPGCWAHPGELPARLPDGYRLTPDTLFLPDGTPIDFIPMPPDREFPRIFESACRYPPTEKEIAAVADYRVNIGLRGPGGSTDAAVTMLEAGAAIIEAGGAGVFIDNSALAFGGGLWTELAGSAGPDAVSFAFVSLLRSPHELRSVGMHGLGSPDFILARSNLADDEGDIVDAVISVCAGEDPIGEGDVLHYAGRPQFATAAAPGDGLPPDSPMRNPFGRLRLIRLTQIAADN